jgi:hypothetical protein
MNEHSKTLDLELKRLLIQLNDLRIPEVILEAGYPEIGKMLCQTKWDHCDKSAMDVAKFVCNQNKKWARQGSRIIIDGGSEKSRRKIMNYCLCKAILANFSCLVDIALKYDWPTLMPTLGNYNHPNRIELINNMQDVSVLGLTEIDFQAKSTGDLDNILTSIIRSRMLNGKPTIITLRQISEGTVMVGGSAIEDALTSNYCEDDDDIIVRMRVGGIE